MSKVCITASLDNLLPIGINFLSGLKLLKQEVIIFGGVEFQNVFIFRQCFYYFLLQANFSIREGLRKYCYEINTLSF